MTEHPNRPNEQAQSKDEKQIVKRRRIGSEKLFPGKLHDLLSFAEREGLERVMSWSDDGRSFFIYNSKELLKVLPLFFGHTKYRSFQRQLNMWSFVRALEGKDRGAFTHPYFMRGHKALCKTISREKFRSPPSQTGVEISKSPDTLKPPKSLEAINANSKYPEKYPDTAPQSRNSEKRFQQYKKSFKDGDRVDFAGKSFHFMDVGSGKSTEL